MSQKTNQLNSSRFTTTRFSFIEIELVLLFFVMVVVFGSMILFAIDVGIKLAGFPDGLAIILKIPQEFIPIISVVLAYVILQIIIKWRNYVRSHETLEEVRTREQRPVHTHINVKKRREIHQFPVNTKKRMGNYVANSSTDKKQALIEADKLRSKGYWTKVYYNTQADKWITYRSTWKQKEVDSKGIPVWKRTGRNN